MVSTAYTGLEFITLFRGLTVNSELDSIVFTFPISRHFGARAGHFAFKIHPLEEKLSRDKRYYASTQTPYGEEEIAAFDSRYDALGADTLGLDTVVVHANKAWAAKIFELIKTSDDGFDYLSARQGEFKGLAIVPDPSSTALLGINRFDFRMRIHYIFDPALPVGEQDTLFYAYETDLSTGYSSYETNFTGTVLTDLPEGEQVAYPNYAYAMAAMGFYIAVDLSVVREAFPTTTIVNDAELSLGPFIEDRADNTPVNFGAGITIRLLEPYEPSRDTLNHADGFLRTFIENEDPRSSDGSFRQSRGSLLTFGGVIPNITQAVVLFPRENNFWLIGGTDPFGFQRLILPNQHVRLRVYYTIP